MVVGLFLRIWKDGQPRKRLCMPNELLQTHNESEFNRISLLAVTRRFDEFISKCMDDQGKPKAPSLGDIAQARACLPINYKNSFIPKVGKK